MFKDELAVTVPILFCVVESTTLLLDVPNLTLVFKYLTIPSAIPWASLFW